jgi:hypothetical protein
MGKNNCYFNFRGTCTNPKITRNKPTTIFGSGRDWDSKQNCTFTQDGAQTHCTEYLFKDIYTETKFSKK